VKTIRHLVHWSIGQLGNVICRALADDYSGIFSEYFQTWERKRTLGTGAYGAVSASYVANGDAVVTAFKDDSIWFWNSDTFALFRKLTTPLLGSAQLVRSFCLSPDCQLLVTCGNSPLMLVWDTVDGVLLYAIRLPRPVASAQQVRNQRADTHSLLFRSASE
jgi:WD40 repeat protein